jgi:hypothetical protein
MLQAPFPYLIAFDFGTSLTSLPSDGRTVAFGAMQLSRERVVVGLIRRKSRIIVPCRNVLKERMRT